MPKLRLPPVPKGEAYKLALATAQQTSVRIANPDLFEQYIASRIGGMDGKVVAHRTVLRWVEAYDGNFNKILVRDTELCDE